MVIDETEPDANALPPPEELFKPQPKVQHQPIKMQPVRINKFERPPL